MKSGEFFQMIIALCLVIGVIQTARSAPSEETGLALVGEEPEDWPRLV